MNNTASEAFGATAAALQRDLITFLADKIRVGVGWDSGGHPSRTVSSTFTMRLVVCLKSSCEDVSALGAQLEQALSHCALADFGSAAVVVDSGTSPAGPHSPDPPHR